MSAPVECSGHCYSMTESGAGYLDPDCPKHSVPFVVHHGSSACDCWACENPDNES